jgi:Leucine-rich repeat (LRR) protein
MSQLTDLNLGFNMLLYCSIPDAVSELTSLQSLSLYHAALGGTLPNVFYKMTNLTIINLMGNLLEGSIPDSLYSLSNLKSLDLSSKERIL